MKRMKSFLLTGAIALTAMTLTTACSDKDDDNSGNAWDAGKIAGAVTGTWWGQYDDHKTVTLDNGKTMRGVKSVQGYKFNNDGTGVVYNYLINAAFEPIGIYGGSMDENNGAFTYTTNADSTITITRKGDGDNDNPKTWTAALTKDGLQVVFGSQAFTSGTANEYQQEVLSEWETKLRTGSNDLADESFLTKWWEQEKVSLLIDGNLQQEYTPWGAYDGKGAAQDIPTGIRFYNSADDGWQMAFCHLTNDSKTHWFGLYNKNSAVLRVFFYVNDATEFGNELIFDLISSNNDKLKYPLYHAMEYGIPSNHKINDGTLSSTANLTSATTSSSDSWEWFLTPYSMKSSEIKTAPYWHCFDFDMSAYIPGATSWIDGINTLFTPYFTIDACSQSTSKVSLTGTLTGSISGTMETYKTEVQQSSSNSTMSKAQNILGNIGSMCSSIGMAAMQIGMLSGGGGGGADKKGGTDTRNTTNTEFSISRSSSGVEILSLARQQEPTTRSIGSYIKGGLIGTTVLGTLCSITSTILGMTNKTEYTTYIDTIPSKLDLDVNCDIDLSGSITEWKSNNAAAIDFTKGLYQDSGEECNIGEGLWSLADDPVIYIDKEDILSSSNSFNVTATSDGYTAYSDHEEDSVRLVCFLDPNSIKINLNPERYHEIDTVKVNIGYGVNYNREKGSTDCYRTLLKLDDRPTFKFLDSASKGDKIKVKRGALTASESSAGYKKASQSCITLDPSEIAEWYNSEFKNIAEANPKAAEYVKTFELVKQSSGNIRFYGPTISALGTQKVLFPQVFVPYNGTSISYPECPDFFVWVNVGFHCKEGDVELNKTFIPKVKLISHSETETKMNEIYDFCTNSYNGNPVGKLASDESIDVYAPYGNALYIPTVMTLSNVIEQVK